MPEQSGPPGDWLTQLRQSYSSVQLGPGVVGKTTRATLGLMGAWAVILFRLGTDVWMNVCLLVGGAAVTAAYFWWVSKTQAFAAKHPQLALLEGAQLIEYQKWEAAINGKVLPPSLPVPDPDGPIKIGRRK